MKKRGLIIFDIVISIILVLAMFLNAKTTSKKLSVKESKLLAGNSEYSFDFVADVDYARAKVGDTVTIKLSLENLSMGEDGLNSVIGYLTYDESVFDEVSIEGVGNWNFERNEDKSHEMFGKFAIYTMQEGVTTDQQVAIIKAKLKTGIDPQTTEINFTRLQSSNGEVSVDDEDRTTVIEIYKESDESDNPDNPDNPDEPNNPDNPDNGNDADNNNSGNYSGKSDSSGKGEQGENAEQDGSEVTKSTHKNNNNKPDSSKTSDAILVVVLILIIAIIALNVIIICKKQDKEEVQEGKSSKKEENTKGLKLGIISAIVITIVGLIVLGITVFANNAEITSMINSLDEKEILLNSEKYLVTDETVSRIAPLTNIDEISDKFNKEIIVYEEGTDNRATTGLVKTGMRIYDSASSYNVSVLGDINGDGESDQIELANIIRAVVNPSKWNYTGVKKLSADMNVNGVMDEGDVSTSIRYILYGDINIPGINQINPVTEPKIEVVAGTYNNRIEAYEDAVQVKISVLDENATKTKYKIEGTTTVEYADLEENQTITITENGVYKISAYSYGIAGNRSQVPYIIVVKKSATNSYKVEYYYQENGVYKTEADGSKLKSGEIDTEVSVDDIDKTPARQGYVLDESKQEAYTATVDENGSTVLKVYFKQQFTVTYKPGEHGTFAEQKTENLDYNENTPEFTGEKTHEAGYTFSGWDKIIADIVTKNEEYTATWEVENYTITYDLAGGQLAEGDTNETNYNVETETFTLYNPTKEGYVFDGWSGTGIEEKAESVTITKGSTGDRTYTANWKPETETVYHVKYYTENLEGNGYELNEDKEEHGTTGEIATVATKAITGFTYDAENTNNKISETIAADGSTVLEVYYSRNSYEVEITKDENIDSVTGANTYKYGATVNITATPKTEAGYTIEFSRWKTENTTILQNETDRISPTATFTMPAEKVVLQATGTKTANMVDYKVEYYYQTNGEYLAEPNIITRQAQTGTTVAVTAEDKVPATTGYAYDEYATGKVESATVAGDGTTTLKLYFKQQFTVTYKPGNHGTFAEQKTKDLAYNEIMPAFTGEMTHEAGYKFAGWDKTVENKVTKNEEYTATWEVENYTITYDLAGGQLAEGDTNETNYNVETETFTLHNPTKEGYVFDGWTGTGIEEKSTSVTITKGSTGDRTYTAKWTPVANTVYHVKHYTENLEGNGYELNEDKEEHGTTGETATATAKTITGFTYDAENTNNKISETIAADGSTVLEVYYTRNSYEVEITKDENIDSVTGANTYKYGATVNITATPKTEAGYTIEFVRWETENTTILQNEADRISPTATFTMPAEKVVLQATGTKTANMVDYKVEYYYQTNGEYLAEPNIITRQAQTGTTVAVTAEDKVPATTGYAYDEYATGKVESATVAGDGTTTLKLYFKQQFTVTYKPGNHGTFAEQKTKDLAYNEIMPAFTGEMTHEAGYKFAGWDKTVENKVTKNEEYTATWEVENYTITYDLAGGQLAEGDTNETNYNVETETFTLHNPTKEGYVFDGWTGTGIEGKIASVTITKGSTGDRTYTANWKPETETVYHVKYYTENIEGNGYELNEDKEEHGTTGETATVATKAITGFTYDAENTNNKLSETIAANGSTVLEVYYSRNSYEVEITKDENIDSVTGANTYKYGATVNITATPKTEVGYTIKFARWKTENTTIFQNETDRTKSTISFTMPAEKVVLQATGTKEANAVNYKVEFYYQQNGVYPAEAGEINTVTRQATTGTTATVTAEDKVPETTGYAYDENATGKIESATVAGDGTTTLKLYFKQQFTVTYKPGEHGTFEEQKTENLDYNENTPEFTGEKTHEAGYTFSGWDKIIADIVTKIEEYTATWQVENYTITYDLAGGQLAEGDTNETNYNVETETFTLYNPTKEGYVFDGWSGTGIEGKSTSVAITKGSTGNKIYTANWVANNYYIQYNANGGTGSMENQTMTYGTSANLTENAYKRDGYKFNGWNTKEDGSGTNYADKESVENLSDENGVTVVLYAQWKYNDYIECESIVQGIRDINLPDGTYTLRVNGKVDDEDAESKDYKIELLNFYDDVTYSQDTTLGDDSTEYKMLVAKYHQNLTIDEGVTVTARNIDNLTYKKGMYLCVLGTLTNNGTISMTARGTYNCAGENVYLWKNNDESYEYVPAIGGTGGAACKTSSNGYWWHVAEGINGANGINRQTAGGGSGASANWFSSGSSGKGGNGTSYSGGTGGGSQSGGNIGQTADAGSDIGGPGGNANVGRYYSTDYAKEAGGGAGNTGGLGEVSDSNNYQGILTSDSRKGQDGTGGLLIIYSNTLNNNGNISSNGSNGGLPSFTSSEDWYNDHNTSGGSSGGGSINIFTNYVITQGNITATGGSTDKYIKGGEGGQGSVTVDILGTGNLFEITLNNKSATTTGTTSIYEKYNVGFYLQNDNGTVSNQMSTNQNGITIPEKDGYTFGGYYTEENGEGIQYIDENGKLTSTASATNYKSEGVLYAQWEANEISFVGTTLTSGTYGTAYTSEAFTGASNGSGNYTYTIKSENPAGATINSENRTISFTNETPAGTYNVVVEATDTETGKKAEATFEITINKQTVSPVTGLTVGTDGTISWTNSDNATGYEMSLDGTTYAEVTNNGDYSRIITATPGTKTIYIKAINSDTTNYETTAESIVNTTVSVYSVTLTKGTGIDETTGAGNYINGATVTLGATVSDRYTWSKWTNSSTGDEVSTVNEYEITVDKSYELTANASLNICAVTLDANGGTYDVNNEQVSTSTKEYEPDSVYGELPTPTRAGYTFKGWSYNNLPAEYQEVECIKFNGNQYIDTGLVPSNHETEIKCNFDTYSVEFLFGTVNEYYHLHTIENHYRWGIGTSSRNGGTWTSGDHTVVFNGDNNSVVIDGTTIGSGVPLTSSANLLLGARIYNGNIQNPLSGKIYYAKVTDKSTGNLVRHMIPCYRKSDNVIGLYDLVSGIFYTNIGTGTFEKGNDVDCFIDSEDTLISNNDHTLYAIWKKDPQITLDANGGTYELNGETVSTSTRACAPGSTYGELPTPTRAGYTFKGWSYNNLPAEYQEVEYIKFNGNQYIDTGLVPSNHETEIKCNFDTYSVEFLFGTVNEYYHLHTTENHYRWGIGTSNRNGGTWTSGDHTVVFNGDNNSVVIDGTTIGSGVPLTSSANLLLGARIYNGNIQNPLSGKIYYAKVTDKSTENLVRHMIPCYRKSDNVIGMYDLIEGRFYENSGKNTFGIGNDYDESITAETQLPINKNHTLYAKWEANELTFTGTTLTSGTYGIAYTSETFTEASNGSGNYTYTIKSENPAGATINSENRTISFTNETPAGTYNVVVEATDTETGKKAEATFEITINKQTVSPVTGLTVGTDGTISWTNSDNATGYEMSLDGTTYAEVTNNGDYSRIITATPGTKTIYIKAINSDTTNYETTAESIVNTTVSVYSVTLTKGTGIDEVAGAGNYINGAIVSIAASVTDRYIWENWTDTSTEEIVNNARVCNITVNKNYDLTANATEPSGCTVTLDANGGTYELNGETVSTSTRACAPGSTYGELPTPTREGYTFVGWSYNNLPAEYQDLEYIQFNFGNYIDTGIVPSNHTTEIKFDFDNYSSDECLFGSSSGSKYYSFTAYDDRYYWGTNDTELNGGTWQSGAHTLIYNGDNNEVKIDGEMIGSGANITAETNLWIGKKRSASTDYTLEGKVYYVKITDKTTGNLVRNMIPCYRLSDNMIGMYDTINDVFYTNQGTRKFSKDDDYFITPSTQLITNSDHTLGAVWRHNPVVTFDANGGTVTPSTKTIAYNGTYGELPTPTRDVDTFIGWSYNCLPVKYQEVEYIQFNAGSYIDTGIVPSNHTTEIKFDFDDYVSNECLLGSSSGSKYYSFTSYADRYYWGTNGTELNGGTWESGIHTLIYNGDNNDVMIDHEMLGSERNIYTTSNLWIGKKSSGTTLDGKVYYVKITDKTTGNVVRNMIPCYRKDDNVIGMYDLISEVFYTNDGVGQFDKGADYSITSTTHVLTNDDHTLKAIWANNPIVTFDANGGIVDQTTKNLTYNGTYGELPTPTKEGYTFMGWNYNNVPDEYQEVEYVEFNAGNYIDTGIVPSNHTTEIKFDFNEYYNNECLFGTSGGDKYYHFTAYSNKYYWGRSGNEIGKGSWTSGSHTLIYNERNNAVILDGTMLDYGTNITATSNLWIGKKQSVNNLQGKVYYVKITDKSTGNVVRDMIPCYRKSDNVIGMYDLVEGVFYTNEGTSQFDKGDHTFISQTTPVITNEDHTVYAQWKPIE